MRGREMAKLNKQEYEPRPLQSLEKPVVLVIDLINGFIHEGALADPEIDEAAKNTEKLLKNPRLAQTPVWFVCDTHSKDAKEFSAFPAHCLKGTAEAEVVDRLQPWVKPDHRIEKNAIGFMSSPDAQKFLSSLKGDEQVIVTGCCTDLCVLQGALGLQSWANQNDMNSLEILVPTDCVETYHIPEVHDAAFWNEYSLKNMAANGISVISSLAD